jgi:hypothetical protein
LNAASPFFGAEDKYQGGSIAEIARDRKKQNLTTQRHGGDRGTEKSQDRRDRR